MKLSIKPGVKFDKDSLAMSHMLATLLRLTYAGEVVITSGTDGVHKPNSRHYKGEAVDIRTANLPDPGAFQKLLSDALGQQFTVLDEGDHLHVQPRKGTTYP